MPTRPVVLAVDDQPNNLKLLSKLLDNLGYDVRACRSGAMALKNTQLSAPDIILLDIDMPEMNGYEVCEKIVNTPSLAHIPVIFLSGHVDLDQKIKAFRVGGRDYIEKPYNVEEVAARLGVHLALERSKELERQRSKYLEETMRRKLAVDSTRDQMMNMLVHDLRAPLQVLRTLIDVVEVENEQVGSDRLEQISQSGLASWDTLNCFVDHFLEVGKIKSTQMPAATEAVDLREVFYKAHAAIGSPAQVVAERLDFEVVADPALLARVLVNLCCNAIRHADTDDDIVVHARLAGEENVLEIIVADTGKGIDAAELDRIFEAFYHGSDQNDGSAPSGLGLAFCKAAIEAQQGSIRVNSVEGAGTTFTISLPLATEGQYPSRLGNGRADLRRTA